MSWSVPRFDYMVTFSGASHVGNVRSTNEDAWRADPGMGVFAIADGMGGHAAGEVAARLGVDQTLVQLRQADALRVFDAHLERPALQTRAAVFGVLSAGVRAAHERVLALARQNPGQRGMGCTLDVLLLLGSHGFLAHVGDSRVFLVRPSTTIQLTADHTIRSSLLTKGHGTPSEPPQAAEALTNAIGRHGSLTIDEVFVELAPGDRVVLCTDGVYGEIADEAALQEIVTRGRAEECAVMLVNAALGKAGRDNATAVVVDVGQQRVHREASDGGLSARDFAYARHSPLLVGIKDQLVAQALQSAIEVKFKTGDELPRFDVADRVGYIMLDGSVVTPQGWTLGPSALLYPESLAGGGRGRAFCKAVQDTRAFRIRADDLREVCQSNPELAAGVYERLARNLARMLG